MRELELYLHIPFCVKKCGYCDFLSAPGSDEAREAYVKALKREIENFPYKKEYRVGTVFFGGGTPSLLAVRQMEELMETMRGSFAFEPLPEITIECNPGTADLEKLTAYRKMGVNRISFGLQSADDGELRTLGRIHTWEEFLAVYEDARKAGFDNVNVDLMSGLPGQTAASWERTLGKTLELSPEHISAYSLIIEEGTPFYERYGEDALRRERGEWPRLLPSEEEERLMYRRTMELLGEAGLRRYEISNYALPGRECRHNVGYWRGTEYAGFGLGAASLLRLSGEAAPGEAGEHLLGLPGEAAPGQAGEHLLGLPGEAASEQAGGNLPGLSGEIAYERVSKPDDGNSSWEAGGYARLKNPENMAEYLAGDFGGREVERLTLEDRMEEFMFLGLRMTAGVEEQEFFRRFGREIGQVYGGALEKLRRQGLIRREGGRIALTPRGTDVSNTVMAEFLFAD